MVVKSSFVGTGKACRSGYIYPWPMARSLRVQGKVLRFSDPELDPGKKDRAPLLADPRREAQ